MRSMSGKSFGRNPLWDMVTQLVLMDARPSAHTIGSQITVLGDVRQWIPGHEVVQLAAMIWFWWASLFQHHSLSVHHYAHSVPFRSIFTYLYISLHPFRYKSKLTMSLRFHFSMANTMHSFKTPPRHSWATVTAGILSCAEWVLIVENN